MRLSCYGLSQECLAGAGRAHKQCSLGELGANLHIFAGVMQEIHHFLQGLLSFVFTRDIREGDACVLLHVFLGRTLADAAHEAAAAGSAEYKAHDHP